MNDDKRLKMAQDAVIEAKKNLKNCKETADYYKEDKIAQENYKNAQGLLVSAEKSRNTYIEEIKYVAQQSSTDRRDKKINEL